MFEHMRILVVDDQLRARQSLKALLATWPQVEEIREASNGQQAVRLIEESRPDIVLMDILMPELDGLQATRLIKTRWPQVQVIVLTMYGEYLDDAVAAGADGFFIKGEPPERLLAMFAAVAASNHIYNECCRRPTTNVA
jgi:DNA-binding NarL/FixJ family response regulator